MPTRIDDSKYWRAQADAARSIADQLLHPESRTVMLQIALGYAALARFADRRQKDRDLKRHTD
jgi:hypothetical protein